MSTKHVMLDLESMGDECVSSIGMVVFDPYDEDTDPEPGLQVNVRWGTLAKYGIHPDEKTIRWWLEQDPEAIRMLSNPTPVAIEEALVEVDRFWHIYDCRYLWSHSYYDAAMMNRIYSTVGRKRPWHGRDIRDFRMIVAMSDKGMRKEFQSSYVKEKEGSGGLVRHSAFCDAVRQAEFVQFVLGEIQRRTGHKINFGGRGRSC